MTVPTLPTAPTRSMNQDTFDATLDAWIASLQNWTAVVNAMGITTLTGSIQSTPIGDVTPSTGAFTTLSANYGGYSGTGEALYIGANVGNSSEITNAVNKHGAIVAPHYLNAEEKIIVSSIYNSSSANAIEYGGGLAAYNAATTHIFYTAANATTLLGTQRVEINNTGLAVTGTIKGSTTIGVGNATPAASGAGITFPATQSASSDANTLDDYEEGTWTPTLGGTSVLSITEARYTKIGRVVTLTTTFSVTSLGTGSTFIVTGVPFIPWSTTAMSVGFFSGIATAAVSLYSYCDSGGNFVVAPLSASGVTVNVATSVFSTATIMRISGTYFI